MLDSSRSGWEYEGEEAAAGSEETFMFPEEISATAESTDSRVSEPKPRESTTSARS